jgi:hypothetical protein
MRFLPKTQANRRDFFRAGARYSCLAVLGAVASLAARKSGPANQTCINRGLCGTCGAFAQCGLPQALSAKAKRGTRA